MLNSSTLSTLPTYQAFITAKHYEQQLTKERCNKRIKKMVDTINNKLSQLLPTNINKVSFGVTHSNCNQMVNDTLKFINNWDGGRNYLKYNKWQDCHVKVIRTYVFPCGFCYLLIIMNINIYIYL